MGITMPNMVNSDGIQERTQQSFGGLNHRLGARDGEIWSMQNMCSDNAPILSTRPKRVLVTTIEEPNGLFAWNALAWVDGDGFYYAGQRVGSCSRGRKRFCGIGAYIIIMPDKLYYNTITGEFGSMESSWSGSELTFTNGKLFDENATANCIQATGTAWADYFREGDAVTIAGCTKHEENNKTPIIRQIDGDKLYFYENIFKLDGDEGTTEYTETGSLTVQRLMPEMDFVVENENRLWGCGGNEIYASKLGDIFNWNVFDGLTTDSFAVLVGSAGAFEGATSFIDYPTFFKGDRIYKMYGYYPSNFQLMSSATLGMDSTGEDSCAIAGDKLYYLGATGFCAYSGGVPASIHDPLNTRYKNAVAGSDGRKYYVSAENEEGKWDLLVFDTQTALWHREDDTHALGFARLNGDTYLLNEKGEIWKIGSVRDPAGTEEEDFDWEVEFADETFGSPDTKELHKLQIRMELDIGAWAEIYILYDGQGRWSRINMDHSEGKKRSVFLPVKPARCDHYRLKIKGHGGCKIWSINRQFSLGSEWRHYYK